MNLQKHYLCLPILLLAIASCANDGGRFVTSLESFDDDGADQNGSGDDTGGTVPPGTVGVACETNDAPEACGAACNAGTPCTGGTYCNINVCAADCTTAGGECSGETVCSLSGRCVSTGEGGSSDTCANVTLEGETATPNLVFLVDNSGSMNNNFGGQPRWQAVRNFLVGGDDSFVSQRNDQLKMGISLYTSYGKGTNPATSVPNGKDTNNNTCTTPAGMCPQLCTVEPTLSSYTALSSVDNYPTSHFGDDTPTGDSLSYLVDTLHANPNNTLTDGKLRDADGDEFVIILATDGAPDRCEAADPNDITNNPEAYSEAEEAAETAFDSFGVRVFTMFVGSLNNNADRAHMNRVACLGVGEDEDCAVDQDDRFFEVTNSEQLSSAINDLVTEQVVSCTVSLKGELVIPNGQSCPSGGTLFLNSDDDAKDRNLTCGTSWEVVDPTTIRVLGTACDDLKEPGTTLSGEFPCGAAKVI